MAALLRHEIVGDKVIADNFIEQTLLVTGKSEQEFYNVITTDGWLSVPISKIGTISKIIANSTNATIRITYTDGGSQTLTLPINGIFVYSIQAAFSATITAIDVSTDSATALDISISVIGE
jgi:hypothetical protein